MSAELAHSDQSAVKMKIVYGSDTGVLHFTDQIVNKIFINKVQNITSKSLWKDNIVHIVRVEDGQILRHIYREYLQNSRLQDKVSWWKFFEFVNLFTELFDLYLFINYCFSVSTHCRCLKSIDFELINNVQVEH